MEQGSAVGAEGSYSTASIERGGDTVREGGEELVYSYRGRGGAGVQLEREGWSWCTVREGGEELVYS